MTDHYYVPDELRTANGMKQIIRYVCYPPHTHNDSPIKDNLTAIECVLSSGRSRWFGCKKAYINSELRMVAINPAADFKNRWELVPAGLQVSTPEQHPGSRRLTK